MNAQKVGRMLGPLIFAITLISTPPTDMPSEAWLVAGLVIWMAIWWMTEAIPLSATALLPFIILPLAGVMSAKETASAYYAPILFLLLGGAFIALAIERTGLHKRLALSILNLIGSSSDQRILLFAFMTSAALLSMIISNTSTALIMMPMAIAVLTAGQSQSSNGEFTAQHDGMSGALPMGIAFAASIGGLGTLIGSPTNGIAVALLDEMTDLNIGFSDWMMFGLPVVLIGIPCAVMLISWVQKVHDHPFDVAAARSAINNTAPWSSAEKRLVPIIALTFFLWMSRRWFEPYLPDGSWTDGSIAVIAGLALFLIRDNAGRPLLKWEDTNRAPWAVMMMFGGGLALAAGMQNSGLADWLGSALLPLEVLPLILLAMAIVGMVVLVTEFASNVATASAIIPVVASLVTALGLKEEALLLAMPAALAASWGFILPAGTGPNAIAWSTGRLKIQRLVKAGLILDLIGIILIVLIAWGVTLLR